MTGKMKKIKARNLRKAQWQAEKRDAGLANTPPAVKGSDLVPTKVAVTICRLCTYQSDCDSSDPTKTMCQDFARVRPANKAEILDSPPKPQVDLSHLNKKANGLAAYRNQLLAEWRFHKAEANRIEQTMNAIEKEIHKLVVAKTIVVAKTAKTATASEPAKAKVDYSDVELDF